MKAGQKTFTLCHGCGLLIGEGQAFTYDKNGNIIHKREYCMKKADKKVDAEKRSKRPN